MAALISWGIALFEYLVQMPANRIGYRQLSLAQLKIIQEVCQPHRLRAVRAAVHAPPPNMNFVWAGLCLIGAVFFVFR